MLCMLGMLMCDKNSRVVQAITYTVLLRSLDPLNVCLCYSIPRRPINQEQKIIEISNMENIFAHVYIADAQFVQKCQ